MRNLLFMLVVLMAIALSSCTSKALKPNSDREQQKKTEQAMQEANRQTGMPAISRFQEKKMLKWIYELCDQENLICHAYLFNELEGKVGQYLGKCIGYGIPYSTQYSNPQKIVEADAYLGHNWSGIYTEVVPQPEPNGLFKPEGLSATWLIMVDPETGDPRPVYVEPTIIVSPFKLH